MAIKFPRLLGVLSLILLGGCYPKGAEYVEELDLVYTNHDDQFNFGSKTTFAIPDSVIEITGQAFEDPDGNHMPDFLPAASAQVIVDQLRQNMTSYGWTEVNKNNHPDVILLPSVSTTVNLYYYYDWWYWGWYYPGWYPGWGWYYPGYYPPYITGYRSGSLFVQMIDHSAAISDGTIGVKWSCIINGLAEGGSSNIASRVQNSIDKAFAQSPYLKH